MEEILESKTGSPGGSDELVSELVLSRRPRRVEAIQWSVVRSLAEADLAVLEAPPTNLPSAQPSLRQIRSAHHQLAQLLARGIRAVDVSRITGYSTSYISNLRKDPAFVELLAHYETERKAIFLDTIEQLKILGLGFKEELQARLEADPAKFTNREVMEAMKLLLVDSRPPVGPSAGAGIRVEVTFEGAEAKPRAEARAETEIAVDVEFSEVKDAGVE